MQPLFLFTSWMILDILISEVFCGLEDIGSGVFITRCNLIVSLDFKAIVGDFCFFLMSSNPLEPARLENRVTAPRHRGDRLS